MAVTDVVEDHRLPGLVPGRAEQVEGPPGVAQRVGGALLPLGQPGQAAVDSRLADLVTDRLEQRAARRWNTGRRRRSGRTGRTRGRDRAGRAPPRPRRPPGGPRPAPARCARALSSQAPRRRKKVLRVHASCQAWLSRPASAASRTAASSPACSAAEPGHRLLRRGGLARDDPGLGRAQRERVEVRLHQHRGLAGGVQVVVEDAAHGRVAGVLAVVRQGLLGGVGTEQVVEGVPARGRARRAGAPGSARPAARGPGPAGPRRGWPRRPG